MLGSRFTARPSATWQRLLDVSYVDLFQSSQKLYDTVEEPLTINGIHLKDSGNRYLAEAISKQLLGEGSSSKTPSAALREAVVDKKLPLVQSISGRRWQ